jgi:hypothetical protein
MTLHQLYLQLNSRAQKDPNVRVRDFRITVSECHEGKVLLTLTYTQGQGRARDLAATVLAFYGENSKSGPMNSKLHWFKDFWTPVQRIYGSHTINIAYAKK